jgi:hypothetical protein
MAEISYSLFLGSIEKQRGCCHAGAPIHRNFYRGEAGGWEAEGTTNDLERRVYQHKCKLVEGFTKRYDITRLVYFESTGDVTVAHSQRKAN